MPLLVETSPTTPGPAAFDPAGVLGGVVDPRAVVLAAPCPGPGGGPGPDAVPALAVLGTPAWGWRVEADGRGGWTGRAVGAPPPADLPAGGGDLFTALDAVLGRWARPTDAGPFPGGWMALLHYPLGTLVEPTGGRTPRAGTALLDLLRLDDAEVLDARTGRGWSIGRGGPARGGPRQVGGVLGVLAPDADPARYRAGVARVVEYLHAGDAFQVNLAHRFSSSAEGVDGRALFARLAGAARPRHGMYAESIGGGRAVLSLSPERFLAMAPGSRRVWTRPMKGTRPGHDPAAAEALRASVKDRAELAMIVDLMRNDLGRVAEPGTVRVDEGRAIEPHASASRGAVLQAVATVSADLRAGRTLGDLLRATFPPGSVTGAPKVRAMQIIDALEAHERGIYTGAIGLISDTGLVDLNVAIRTGVLEGGRLVYHAGAGIVADSDPDAELAETIAKTGVVAP